MTNPAINLKDINSTATGSYQEFDVTSQNLNLILQVVQLFDCGLWCVFGVGERVRNSDGGLRVFFLVSAE